MNGFGGVYLLSMGLNRSANLVQYTHGSLVKPNFVTSTGVGNADVSSVSGEVVTEWTHINTLNAEWLIMR